MKQNHLSRVPYCRITVHKEITLPTVSVSAAPDFSAVISNVASAAGHTSEYVGTAGQTLAEVGAAGTQVLGQVGSAAATGGIQLARYVLLYHLEWQKIDH